MTRAIAFLLCLVAATAACAHARPGPEPAATVMVEGVGVSEIHGAAGWSGTGWYVAGDESASVVLTAGHVCMGEAESFGLTVYSADGREAYVVWDRDRGTAYDLCLLLVDGPAPGVLRLADAEPEPGERVSYRGYPGGVLTVQHGEVLGRVDEGTVVAIDGWYGASGSAITRDRDGRVVGVLVAGFMNHGPVGTVIATGLGPLREARAAALEVLGRLRRAPVATVRGAVAESVRGRGGVDAP